MQGKEEGEAGGMNATEFMVTRGKMCVYYGNVMCGCSKGGEKCPLHELEDCRPYEGMSVPDAERMQAIVEKWAQRNKGTNDDKFKEVFGEDFLDIWTLSSVNAHEWAAQKYEED